MRFGVCTSIDRIPDAASAGYEYVELSVPALLPDEDDAAFASVLSTMRDAALPVEVFNCFFHSHLKVTGPDVQRDAVEKHMKTVLERASQVGASVVVFGSGGARRAEEGFPVERALDQVADVARMAGDIGERVGVTIAMEPLLQKATNVINTVEEGAAFVDRVDHPRVRLLADLFHMVAEGEPLDNIVAAGARLAHIHTATPAIAETGEGTDYDFAGFFRALKRAGYDGRVSVEDNPGLLRGKTPPFTEPYRAILGYLREQVDL